MLTAARLRLPRFKDRSNRTVLLLFLLLLAGTIGLTSETPYYDKPSYVAFGLILLVSLAGMARRRGDGTQSPITVRLYDLVPVGLLIVWVYGILLGLAHHNKIENVIRNFAGMSLYSLYYVLLFRRIRKFDLLRCLVIAAAMNATYMFGFYVWDKVIGRMVAHPLDYRFFDVRTYYADTLALLVAPIGLCMDALLFPPTGLAAGGAPKSGTKPLALIYLYLFAFLQIPLSKATLLAFWLAFLFSMFYFRVQLLQLIRTRHLARVWALAGTILLSAYPATHALVVYVPSLQWNVLAAAITGHAPPVDTKDPAADAHAQTYHREALLAKSRRQRVSEAIIKNLSVLGTGLGTPLGNLEPRDPTGYGYEQTYLNLMHKLGVFSGFIFFAYGLAVWRTLGALKIARTRPLGFGALALWAGLVLGYGNPLLMSPIMVTLHCIVLYWMRPDDRNTAAG